MTHLKKLESISLKMAEAVIDVRSWSGTLAKALDKKKGYNLVELHDEADKIETFALQLKRALAIRYLWAHDHDVSTDSSNKVLQQEYIQMRNQERGNYMTASEYARIENGEYLGSKHITGGVI